MKAWSNQSVNDKLGILDTLLKGLRNYEDVIFLEDDWDLSQNEEVSSCLYQKVKDEECISSSITQNFEFGRSKQAKLFPVSGVEVETSTSTVWDLSAIEILPCRKYILITQLTSPSVTNTSYTPGMVEGDLNTSAHTSCWSAEKDLS